MSDPDTQMFRLLSPDGQEIMAGPMSALMERLPDTHDRNAALETAVRAAKEAVEAEERLQDARACAAQIISDTVSRLCARLDAYVAHQEEQRRQDEEQALRQEQEEIQRTLDQLPDPDEPDDPDNEPYAYDQKEREATLTGTEPANDDGDLTVKHAQDPEHYAPGEREDAEAPVKPALSYGRVPLSYVKKHDEDPLRLTDPIPFDPDAPGAVKHDPNPGPEPGSRIAPPLPQVAQPVSISLNEED
jgi:vacuolar-type H+-ATPase subunit H